MKLKDRLKPKTRTIEVIIDGVSEQFAVREMNVSEYSKAVELYQVLKKEDGTTDSSVLHSLQILTLSSCLIDEDGSQMSEDDVSQMDSKVVADIYTAIMSKGADNSEEVAKK